MTSFVIYALSNMPVNSVMKHDLRLRTLMAAAAAAAANLLQSCPTLCDLIDGSPPGSPVPGILKMTTNVISYYQFSYEIIDQVLPKYSEMQSLLGKYAEMILCLIFSKFCGL